MMMLGFIFLIKLRAVWEMLIQSSVRSGRNYEAEASFPLKRNTGCCHFYHIENETIYQSWYISKHWSGNLEDWEFWWKYMKGMWIEKKVLTWNLNRWERPICDFLYTSNYVLHFWHFFSSMCFLVRSFHRLTSFNG